MDNQPQISRVTFEHHHNGLGVDSDKPRISWSFNASDDVQNWEQAAYELELRRNGIANVQHVRVETQKSILVPWPSEALKSREQVDVRVRAWSTNGNPTEWSDWATVEAALLSKSDWRASLMTSTSLKTNLATDGSLPPIRFRKSFQIPNGTVKKGRLYITAHGLYQAYINGSPVGDQCMAPGWTSYHHRLAYQVYDVTSLLQVGGGNVIAIEVGAGWYASNLGWLGGRRFRFGDTLASLVQLEVDLDETLDRLIVASDYTWLSNQSAIISSEIYNGEKYDARLEQKGWNSSVDFDTSTWTPTMVQSFPQAQLISPDAPPVRITQEVQPIKIFKSNSGKTILDFGQNLVGKLRVNMLNQAQGHEVSFRHAEVMEDGELGIRPLRYADCTDKIISNGDKVEDWSPLFTFHGFRYVQVDGWPTDGPNSLSLDSITALVLHTDMRRTGWFNCSHPMVNKLHQNSVWSMRGNFLSIPSDCPQRDERLGWTGDIQAFSPSANFLYDTSGMLSGWLQDLAAEQLLDGDGVIPPFVVPNVIQSNDPKVADDFWPHVPNAVWDDVTVITPWDLYTSFGDPEVLHEQYQSMKTWVDQGIPRGPDGLWSDEIWQLGDWLDPSAPPEDPGNGKTDGTFVADAYLVRVTQIISQVASALNLPEDTKKYTEDYARLKMIFQNKYITPAGLLVCDTQTALSLAFVFDLFPGLEQASKAAERLARAVRLAQFKVTTGFAGTPLITHALTMIGKPELAYRMLLEPERPSWMYPVLMGATSIWERWDSMLPDGRINPGDMTSFNHYALGSIVRWLHECVGGISPMEPGWKKIKVRPVPGGPITDAQVSYTSPYGKIDCSWTLVDEIFKMKLVIPPNSKAYVVLPDRLRTTVMEEDGEGVWIGSGLHTFSCSFKSNSSWPPKALFPAFWRASPSEPV